VARGLSVVMPRVRVTGSVLSPVIGSHTC
jgi:hypothetical protein